jgi:ribonuclease P protein component
VAKAQKFSKRERLVSGEDFGAVFDAAHTSAESTGSIVHLKPYIIYKKSGNLSRLGLSIARRVIRKSIERNRIKRCIREFFRTHKKDFDGDYIVRVVSRPSGQDFLTLTDPIQSALSKLKKRRAHR